MKKISLITALALAASSLSAAPVEELIKGASIDGSSFFRYISNSGRNDGGQGFVMRALANINSGNIEGFSFNLGLFYHYGGTPIQGSTSDDAVNGSRADRLTGSAGNAFGLSTLFVKYAFDASKTAITAGKMRLATPITNAITDRGVGVLATNSDVTGLTIAAGFFDSWSADNQYIGGILSTTTGAGAGQNIGNNIATIGFMGNYDPITFKLWYFNIDKVANTIFGEFSAGKMYQFKLQVAYTNMYAASTFKLSGNRSGLLFDGTAGAKSRGLYTAQLALKPMPEFGARLGFVGSFGSGYGVALNNEATFSKGGKYWFDNFGNGRSGFSIFGDGGFEDTHINVWYLALTSKVSIVDIGLDIAGISGKNNYTVSARKTPTDDGTNRKVGGANSGNRTFFEITPSLDINITKQAKLSAYYAIVFGQINAQRLWTQVSYKF